MNFLSKRKNQPEHEAKAGLKYVIEIILRVSHAKPPSEGELG